MRLHLDPRTLPRCAFIQVLLFILIIVQPILPQAVRRKQHSGAADSLARPLL